MGYFKRCAIAWVGSVLVFVAYMLAAQGLIGLTFEVVAATTLGAMLCALMPSALTAELVRRCDWGMTLAAQVLTILVVTWFWQG